MNSDSAISAFVSGLRAASVVHGYARRYRSACARRWGSTVAVSPCRQEVAR